MPTYRRKVHETTSILDEGNYNLVYFLNANIDVQKATSEKSTIKNPAKETVWTKRFKGFKKKLNDLNVLFTSHKK